MAALISYPDAATATRTAKDWWKPWPIRCSDADSSSLWASANHFTAFGGQFTLLRQVGETVCRDPVGDIVPGVAGTLGGDNQSVVDPSPLPLQLSSEDVDTPLDDASITEAVRSRLAWSRLRYGDGAYVRTRDGRVTLEGASDSVAASAFAGSLARDTRGVVTVDNQLVVLLSRRPYRAPPESISGAPEQELPDKVITARVQSSYLHSISVDGSRLSVNTMRGVVTLTGTIESEAERTRAVECALNVRGVARVDGGAMQIRSSASRDPQHPR